MKYIGDIIDKRFHVYNLKITLYEKPDIFNYQYFLISCLLNGIITHWYHQHTFIQRKNE
jgi:hypothetical protein